MKDNLTQIIQSTDPDTRWTKDEHAEMSLLVLVHDMSQADREDLLQQLDIPPKEYEYLTEKYSRPLTRLNQNP